MIGSHAYAEGIAVKLIRDIVSNHFPAPTEIGHAEDGSPVLHWVAGDVSLKVRICPQGTFTYNRRINTRNEDGEVARSEVSHGFIDGPDVADCLMVFLYQPMAKEA